MLVWIRLLQTPSLSHFYPTEKKNVIYCIWSISKKHFKKTLFSMFNMSSSVDKQSVTSVDIMLWAFILVPSYITFSHLLCAVHGLSSIPLQQQPHSSSPSRREAREGSVTLPSHRPVERTRSEPPPYSHPSFTLQAAQHSHTQQQLLQQHYKRELERAIQSSLLNKVSGGGYGHTFLTSCGWNLFFFLKYF